MKLKYQLHLAFTTLLLIIMAVTGYLIYSLILDLLIQDEQRQLEQKGQILVNVLNEQYETTEDIQQFYEFLQEQDLQLFLYDGNWDAVLYSTMPDEVSYGFFNNNNFADRKKQLWEYNSDKYVISRILLYPESLGLELILLTPLSDLPIVQKNFIVRLLFVFFIGTLVIIILSYFLTNRLVTPLTRLKWQLKKIEKRQFDEVEPIQATGEIKEVAQSVYDMASELERFITSQQIFFQNASHELKTPLMTIQGYAEGIKENVFDPEEEEKGLEVMVTEVKRLKKIINEMILLAKLDSNQAVYEREEVSADELMEQIIERVLPIVNEKQLTLTHHVERDITLVVDKEKMLRALLNLVFNGIRHATSEVRLEMKKNQKQTVITIEDDGQGIPEELTAHIFHRFVKGKSGETGLGLSIARAIIEQSNGKITVGQSRLGGAKFTITF
ncbi:MAG TPA: HAMP domain-containing sensor histidine kinase [Bacillota bacterium]